MAVSNNGKILNSIDGANWEVTPLEGNPYLQGIEWNGNEYVAVGWNGKIYRGTKDSTTTVKLKELQLQTGANTGDNMSIELSDVRTAKLGINDIDLSNRNGAQDALSKVDQALKIVSSERGKYGASHNRLEHSLKNSSNTSINLTAAESRIRDVDMAKEIMEQTKNSILAQASQAVLAQSHQQAQGVLQLLR